MVNDADSIGQCMN